MGGIVIVGAGECGARAAFALREKGCQGSITLIGAEPYLPYERPPLSKDGLRHEVQPKYVADAERYATSGIDVRTDTPVKAIDRVAKRVELLDGGSIPYGRLLLATGARARTIPGSTMCRAASNAQNPRGRRGDPPRASARSEACHHRRRIHWPRTRGNGTRTRS